MGKGFTMTEKNDDLDAVRKVADAIEEFEPIVQERILKWAMERVGLKISPSPTVATASVIPDTLAPIDDSPAQTQSRDIKSFIAGKGHMTNIEFATAVAYYYQFVAPESEKKESINADDLKNACRLSNRNIPSQPGVTLGHAVNAGLLDRGEIGAFRINTVGENLVTMTLGSGKESELGKPPRSTRRKNAQKKKSSKRKFRKK